jgi:hypothetical protein
MCEFLSTLDSRYCACQVLGCSIVAWQLTPSSSLRLLNARCNIILTPIVSLFVNDFRDNAASINHILHYTALENAVDRNPCLRYRHRVNEDEVMSQSSGNTFRSVITQGARFFSTRCLALSLSLSGAIRLKQFTMLVCNVFLVNKVVDPSKSWKRNDCMVSVNSTDVEGLNPPRGPFAC